MGRIGLTVVIPIKRSWSAVLTCYYFRRVEVVALRQEQTLLIVVGCTSAEGNEKSQYRENVFCHGIKDQTLVISICRCRGDVLGGVKSNI